MKKCKTCTYYESNQFSYLIDKCDICRMKEQKEHKYKLAMLIGICYFVMSQKETEPWQKISYLISMRNWFIQCKIIQSQPIPRFKCGGKVAKINYI